jgi:ABC-type uncharacterized transport system involved in gliding motility auxiliary subunit
MTTETSNARSARRSAGVHNVLRLVLAAIIVLMLNYLGFTYYDHKDLSESQFYALSPKTVGILKKLDAPVTVYTYLNEAQAGQTQQIENLLKEYAQAGGKNFTTEKIDPIYDPKRAVDLQKQLHFDGNDHMLILQYKDRTPRFVKQDDLFEINPASGQTGAFKGEQQLTASLIALIEGHSSRVYFTEGHGEHSIHDMNTPQGFGSVATLLKNENVETETINLASKGDVPADAEAVIIAGPTIPFSAFEAQALDKYLANNGKLLILVDPYRNTGLDAVLQKYGLKFDDDLVLERVGNAMGGVQTVPASVIFQGGFSSQPITAKLAQAGVNLIMMDARSLTVPPAAAAQSKTQFLLQTDPGAWGVLDKGTPQADVSALTPNKATDLTGPLTVAAQYDGGTTTDPTTKATMSATRIVAIGASNFLENDTAEQVGANLFTNAVDWLVKKDAVLDIAPKKPMQYGVALSPISYRTVVWSAAVVVPGAALIIGLFTWFSRRK